MISLTQLFIVLLISDWTYSALATGSIHSLELHTRSISSNLDSEDGGECYGNRMEAAEVGRQCSRRCKKNVPCENSRKQCLCDGLCGLSCIKPDLSCPDLKSLENGDLLLKSNKFNARVIYRCNDGFYLFGDRERLCQGDEEWSGIMGECLPEPGCRNPVKVNHARNPNDGSYRLNDKVNYSCYPGYKFQGSSEAQCRLIDQNRTGWVWLEDEPFRCSPKSCGDPGQIENGKRSGDSFIIASSVLYTCNDGYEISGPAKRYCQSDNHWSGQAPHCEPITCNPTDHLENGKINYVYPLIFNSTVEYECDTGFKIVGLQKRTCGANRKLFGQVPKCEEIDCGEIGPLYNGYINGFSSRMDDRKEFFCLDGMKFVGEYKDSTCLASGNWSNPLPKCLNQCVIPQVKHALSLHLINSDIPLSSNVTNLTIRRAQPDSRVPHGTSLIIVCQKEYELDQSLDSDDENASLGPTCNNGTWSYDPVCKQASCANTVLPNIKNGRVRVVSIDHGAIGQVSCLNGFRLKGDNVTTCQKGQWTPLNSSCSEIYCSYPGSIEYGRVLLIGLTGMYDYKPYIRRISNNRQIAYECENGYRLNDGSPNGATCYDGLWRPEGLPLCIKE